MHGHGDGDIPVSGVLPDALPPLAELLPQREPMVLLSGFEPPVSDDAVSAWVDVTPASPFFDHAAGGVPGCVALEYMAQTMALLVGLKRRRAGLPPQLGFVLGSRRLTISIPLFPPGRRYRVHAACTYSDDEFGSFDVRVEDSDGTTVASGAVTAFQPGEDFDLSKMEDLG